MTDGISAMRELEHNIMKVYINILPYLVFGSPWYTSNAMLAPGAKFCLGEPGSRVKLLLRVPFE